MKSVGKVTASDHPHPTLNRFARRPSFMPVRDEVHCIKSSSFHKSFATTDDSFRGVIIHAFR